MTHNNIIEIVKNKLVETYNPLAIYLFGSYAWGKPDDESDLDILVVVDSYTDTHHKMLVDGHRALARLRIGKDILLYNKEDFAERSNKITNLCYKIRHKGVKIYARA